VHRRPIRSAFCWAILALPGSSWSAETTEPDNAAFSELNAGKELDLKRLSLVFEDEFERASITDDGGRGPWFAPVHTDVGESTWDAYSRVPETYRIENGILKIRALKDSNGRWHAGNIQTVDSSGRGVAQAYGYFEARIKFPDMPGAWCAFWLKAQADHVDGTIVRPEIDVIEWYGGDGKGHHQSVHLWPPPKQYQTPGRLTRHWNESNYTAMRPTLAGQWHTHGVLVTSEYVIFYIDRKEISRFPTFYEFTHALYPLVSLTLYDKDVAKAVSPFEMEVDYVRIYARREPRPPEDLDVH
jgi:beta-glucanase (GH16 family)